MARNPDSDEGMLELECSLCSEKFDSKNVIPRTLKCGHKFCPACINELFQYLKTCPTCKKSTGESASGLPTDRKSISTEILKAMSSESNKKALQDLLEKRRQQMTTKLEIMDELRNELYNCSKELKYLNDLKKETTTTFDYSVYLSYEPKILKIEERLKTINLRFYSCNKPDFKPNILLNNCSSKKKFIYDIVFELLKKRNVYAINSEWYNTHIYCGQLTYNAGRLYIHSFNNTLPEHPSKFVALNDLKKCMTIDNFGTFIDIGKDHFVCSIMTSTVQSLNFIKFCSGEDGNSYKGLTIKSSEFDFTLEKDPPKIVEDNYEFLISLPSVALGCSKDTVVKMNGRKCGIHRIKNNSETWIRQFERDVIASISYFDQIFSYPSVTSLMVVKNCGILIILHGDQETLSVPILGV